MYELLYVYCLQQKVLTASEHIIKAYTFILSSFLQTDYSWSIYCKFTR